jgi:hypothetical protein
MIAAVVSDGAVDGWPKPLQFAKVFKFTKPGLHHCKYGFFFFNLSYRWSLAMSQQADAAPTPASFGTVCSSRGLT